MPPRLALGHFPTPLWRSDALDDLVGTAVWIKRDDMTGGAESGNKLRKLELLLADALERGATTVLTCGAVQSNHARATALLGAAVGLRSVLFLRTEDVTATCPVEGNLLLDRLAGAEIRLVSPADYERRAEVMGTHAREIAQRGERPYVIPEGGSNGLGALGYVEAMREVREQLDLGIAGGPAPFDAVAVACGSGGTAAGASLGADRHGVAGKVLAFAVCNDRGYFEGVVARIAQEAAGIEPSLSPEPRGLAIHDEHKGPAYGVASDEQIAFLVEVARRTGLVLDPVYTGKALFGLSRLEDKPRRVLFVHTGGLPGLLAQAPVLAKALG